MTKFKPQDPVIAPRYVGPPCVDGTVVKTGAKTVHGIGGERETIPTITVKYEDGEQAEIDARSALPGGLYYPVTTPVGETLCSSAAEIAAAIEAYMTSAEEQKSLTKVSVMFMPPEQKTGMGTPLSPTDFYV